MTEEQQEQQFVEVLWEDGSKINCEIYDVIDFENKTYALLIPQEDEHDDEDAEIIVMEYVEEDEDNGYFKTIDDEEEFNRVCEYIQSFEDEEFEDGEE